MFNIAKVAAPSAVLLGVILLIANVEKTYDLGIIPYALIVGGICVLMILALSGNRQQSPFCRIGFHKFIEVGQDSGDMPLYIYRCERCGTEKKVIKAI